MITQVCHVIFEKKSKKELLLLVLVDATDPSGKGVNVGKSSGIISVIDLIYLFCSLIILKIHINFLLLR